MFGRSIYISKYQKGMKLDDLVDFYFTSFHISEEFNEEFASKAKSLLNDIKSLGKQVIVDISPRGVKQMGYETLVDFVNDNKVDMVRLDYGFSLEEMIEVGKVAKIAVNASTVDDETIEELQKHQIEMIAIHNFYPRKETGLDIEYFVERNTYLQSKGVKIGAFIPGDEELRGPMFEGLPTLENHRFMKPYVAYLEMQYLYNVDLIMVGDYGISSYEENLIHQTIKNDIVYLPAEVDDSYPCAIYTNRVDSPSGLIRLQESREYATQGAIIESKNTTTRKRGSITIDNKNYLRYSGEIQITKKDYPADEKVNVIGHIKEDYLSAIDVVKRGMKLEIIKN